MTKCCNGWVIFSRFFVYMTNKLTRQDLKDLQRMFWLSNADVNFIANYVEKQETDRDASLIEVLSLKQWSERIKFQHNKKDNAVDPAQA